MSPPDLPGELQSPKVWGLVHFSANAPYLPGKTPAENMDLSPLFVPCEECDHTTLPVQCTTLGVLRLVADQKPSPATSFKFALGLYRQDRIYGKYCSGRPASMYQAHWGLQESPFRGLLDPKFFYQSPTHEEALARLHFLVDQQRRLGLLVGPSGSGKSLLLEVFAEQLRRHARPVAKLSLLGVEPAEMLWLLAAEWGLSLDPTRIAGPAVAGRDRPADRVPLSATRSRRAAGRRRSGRSAGVAARDSFGPVRSVARDAVDHRVGRPQRGDGEAGRAAVGSGRIADRRGAVGAGRHGGVRQHAAWPRPGGSRPCLPSRPSPGCTSFPTAFPAAFRNWPIWRCWPAPARTSSRSTPTWCRKCIRSWASCDCVLRRKRTFRDRRAPI